MNDAAQRIKEKLDIVDFLKQYLELRPAGINFKAVCPFHREKTPSFMISPERQSWHCFGACNEGGDIIKFLMKYENIEFFDALKILAEKTGVELKSFKNRDFNSYNSLYAIMDAAKEFFKANLWHSRPILDYLKERGLKEETVREFELGVAPESSDALTKHLLKLGYNVLDIERAGLTIKTERGTYWDRFRGRVMFPIANHFGKIIAFTGRILPGNENSNVGKYVNSPETPIFQKSKVLYGFSRTKNDIRDAGFAVVVEGQMDLLMAWQDGVKNVVATSGTALTADHLAVLRRLTDELVFSFDNDEAGQIAAERAIDLSYNHDFSVKLLVIDDANLKDPADVVNYRPGMLKELVTGAKSAMDYYFHKYVRIAAPDMRIKKQNLRIVLSKIKGLASPIDRSHWLKELAAIAKIEERILGEEMEMLSVVGAAAREISAEQNEAVAQKLTRREMISHRLIGVLMNLRHDIEELEEHLKYLPEQHREIYRGFLNKAEEAVPQDLNDLMSAISMRFSFENQNFDAEQLKGEVVKLLKELKVEYLKERRQEISELIRRLEAGGDEKKLENALKEFDIISKEMQNI